jgi:2-oxoglutarate dehydrogenase E2 component (dihydrolipoamide succinyltransferase)
MSRRVPVLAPSEQSEGTKLQVLRWLKPVGASVAENEPLIEIETDKVTVEVPAPVSGVLQEILRDANAEVMPGESLGSIEAEASGSAIATTGAEAVAAAAAAPRNAYAGARDARPVADTGTATGSRHLLSPAVRRLLSRHGLEASTVSGSGAGGRITVDDVLAHVARAGGSGAVPAAGAHQPATPTPRAGVRLVPHSATRKRIAERMVESLLHTAPHVTSLFEVDMSAVLAHRERHRAEFAKRGAPLTLTAYFLKACVAALRDVPEANARWTDDALELYDAIDIGVGTAVESKGLVVPVVRAVQTLDLFGIAEQLNELVVRAREDSLTPADVRGGTFTISNHGVSGSLLAAPIVINQPQTAILGVGKLEKRPVVVEREGQDELVIRPRCYVTLTIDHRVMDGHRANRFLTVLRQELEAGQY